MKMNLLSLWYSCLLGLSAFSISSELYSQQGNQALYENSFDIAAGGTNLTMAAQEGILFANPALLPWGRTRLRWIGAEATVFALESQRQLLIDVISGKVPEVSDMVSRALNEPFLLGVAMNLAAISKHGGASVFGTLHLDVSSNQVGDSGTPVAEVSVPGRAGAVVALAAKMGPLSYGVSFKCLVVNKELAATIELQDIVDGNLAENEKVKNIENEVNDIANNTECDNSFDVGQIINIPFPGFNFRLALKGDHFQSKVLQQLYHAGLGLTFKISGFGGVHASVDYRDAGKTLQQKEFQRIYAGLRLIFRENLALGLGLYQGFASIGLRFRYFAQMGFTYYTKEYGSYIGDKKREKLMLAISMAI